MRDLAVGDPLVIRTRRRPDALVLVLDGELDLASAPQLESELTDASSGSARVIVDLSGLQFMDSTGLQTLLRAEQRCREQGCCLSLMRPSRQVDRLLELTHTKDVFSFEDDEISGEGDRQ